MLVWSVSAVRHNAALAARARSVLVMVAGATFVLDLPPHRERLSVMLSLGAAWALRLSPFGSWCKKW